LFKVISTNKKLEIIVPKEYENEECYSIAKTLINCIKKYIPGITINKK
jgi:hypothetical protein